MSLNNQSQYINHLCLSVKTEAQWTADNPVLMAGELAVCTACNFSLAGVSVTATRFKTGDGVTAFVSLPYLDMLLVNTANALHQRLAAAEALIAQYETLASSQSDYLNSWTKKLEKEEGFN